MLYEVITELLNGRPAESKVYPHQIAQAKIDAPSPLAEAPRIRSWIAEVFEKYA